MTGQDFYVKFFAPVVSQTVAALMQAIDIGLKNGVQNLTLIISSQGGEVYQGLSAYNYLKGIPLNITTHNFGSADSVGLVLYCAGSRRLSVPHARFLLHGVKCSFPQGANLEEDQLEERLKGLRIDQANIARVIADTAGKTREQVLHDMRIRTALDPEQAIEYGLVQEIKSELIPPGSEVISIQMVPKSSIPQKTAASQGACLTPPQ